MHRQSFCWIVLFALLNAQTSVAIQLNDGVSLNDLKVIEGDGVYLEALAEDTAKTVTALMSADLKDNYIHPYFPWGRVDQYRVQATVTTKLGYNNELNFENDREFSHFSFVIRLKDTKQVVGLLEIYSHDKTDAELSIYVSSTVQRQKVATRAVTATLRAAREKTNAAQVYWSCFIENEGSNKLAKSAGFTFLKEQMDDYGDKAEANVYHIALKAAADLLSK